MFALKKKPVVLDLHTTHSFVYEFSRPCDAVKALPAWWRQIPKRGYEALNSFVPTPTMRQCAGFVDYYATSIAIPLWSDVEIEIGAKGTTDWRYQFADGTSGIEIHPAVQRGEVFPERDWCHMKFKSPWAAFCSEPVKFLFQGSPWSYDRPDRMVSPPGVVDYKNQHTMSANILFSRQDSPYRIRLNHGMVLSMLTPLTDRPVELRYHLTPENELMRLIKGGRFTFEGWYAKRKGAAKCPFSAEFKGDKE